MIHAVKRQGAATERTRPPSESHITLNAQGGRRARSSVRPSVRQGRHSVLLTLLPMSRRLLNETGGGIRKGRLNDRKTQVSVWSGGRPCHTDGLTDGPIAEWLPLQQSILGDTRPLREREGRKEGESWSIGNVSGPPSKARVGSVATALRALLRHVGCWEGHFLGQSPPSKSIRLNPPTKPKQCQTRSHYLPTQLITTDVRPNNPLAAETSVGSPMINRAWQRMSVGSVGRPRGPRYDALPYFLPLRLSGSGGLDNLGVRKLNYV